MRDPGLVRAILEATVEAAGAEGAPVTLKIRTGWDETTRNAVEIAGIAVDCGVRALAVHGRTRSQRFKGEAEFDTVRAVVRAVDVPVFANGDVTTPERAAEVLEYTGADGLLIGRAAQGRPWIFRDLVGYLYHGALPAPLDPEELSAIMLAHLDELYGFYGDPTGLRVARKHIAWYCEGRHDAASFRDRVMKVESAELQRAIVAEYFSGNASSEAVAA